MIWNNQDVTMHVFLLVISSFETEIASVWQSHKLGHNYQRYFQVGASSIRSELAHYPGDQDPIEDDFSTGTLSLPGNV